jgi:hypothetical protein
MSVNNEVQYAERHYAEYHYSKCCGAFALNGQDHSGGKTTGR